jgi:hypothetical protein
MEVELSWSKKAGAVQSVRYSRLKMKADEDWSRKAKGRIKD